MSISTSEITNSELKVYKEEYDRLLQERRRLDLQMEAILTTSAVKLEKVYNTRRLDFAHLTNAYSSFTQNDLDSMQFKIADTTIRDLFFTDENQFTFISIIPYESGAYEFLYQYTNKTISIKIPTASNITKDNIDKLEWGVFTVYDILKRTDVGTEKVIICRTDDIDTIKRTLAEYLIPNTTLEGYEYGNNQ